MKLLTDFSLEELKELMASYKEPSFRAEQLYLNLYMGKDFAEMTNVSKALKDRLVAEGYAAVGVRILENYVSKLDGLRRSSAFHRPDGPWWRSTYRRSA